MSHVTLQSIAASMKLQDGMFVTLEKSRRRLANSGLLRFTRRRLVMSNSEFEFTWKRASEPTIQEVNRRLGESRKKQYENIAQLNQLFPQAEIYVIESTNTDGTFNLVKEYFETYVSSATQPSGFEPVSGSLYKDPAQGSARSTQVISCLFYFKSYNFISSEIRLKLVFITVLDRSLILKEFSLEMAWLWSNLQTLYLPLGNRV